MATLAANEAKNETVDLHSKYAENIVIDADKVETYAAFHSKGGGGMPTGTLNTVLVKVNQMRHRFSFGLLEDSFTLAAELIRLALI